MYDGADQPKQSKEPAAACVHTEEPTFGIGENVAKIGSLHRFELKKENHDVIQMRPPESAAQITLKHKFETSRGQSSVCFEKQSQV